LASSRPFLSLSCCWNSACMLKRNWTARDR
jgi:hypothetical protein